jgi:hypothetical protein
MAKDLTSLVKDVQKARTNFVSAASGLTFFQSQFKPAEDVWSVVDIVEHMVWAEQGGINGIWKTLEGIKNNNPIWVGEAIHHGLSIENIIEKTWQPKEKVPETAKPRWGGPVEFWIGSLENCQTLLESLALALQGHDLEKIIYPHIISGPLNVIQRMEFLRFHLQRHQRQIENLKTHPQFSISMKIF